jgi:ABC-2 type transport system permease protein
MSIVVESAGALMQRPAPSRSTNDKPVTQARVIHSEWIKLRTLRSSWAVLGATMLGIVAVGMIASYINKSHWATMSLSDRATFDPVDSSLLGVNFAPLLIGTLGVLFITGEYATGMIRATLTAVPKRVPVIIAKGAVYAAVSFVVALVAALLAFVGGQALLESHGVALTHPGAFRAVFGSALVLAVIGLFGMAIGFVIRSTAGAVATLFGLLLILPSVIYALPSSWSNHLEPYLPYSAGQALYTLHPDNGSLSPWAGFGLLVGYTAILLAVAMLALLRRDA